MTPLPQKTFFVLILIVMAQVAFAQSKACLDEKEKASSMKKNCVEVNAAKGTDEFNKCLEGLKLQVAKAAKICEAANQEPTTSHAKTPTASKPKPTVAPAKPQPDSTAISPKETPQPVVAEVESEEEEELEEENEIVAPAAHANASGVSDKCIEELVELPNTKANFNMASFPQDLATTVVKVQGGAKFQSIPIIGSMLGPGPDDKITDAGITVGCAKEMPTDVGKIKSLLLKVGLEMGKSAVASKLGIKKNELPSNVSELKDFAVKTATLKISESLGIEASEVPTDLKGMENLASETLRKQAAKKLGVEKSSIPNDKSELSGFIKEAAKAKIAKELEIKTSEVNLSRTSLAEYAKEEEDLAPIANLVNAANILEVLGLVNQLSALTGGSDSGDNASAVAAKITEPSKPQSNDTRFGIRANISNARVYPSLLQINSLTGPKTLYIDGGIGYGLSLFAIIPISSFHLVPEISGQRRKPIQIDGEDYLAITETAIEIPLTFRFFYSEGNLIYLGIGVFGGMVFDMITDPPETDYKYIKNYRSKDYGLVLELGFRITDGFSIDARGTASAASFGIGEYLGSGDTPRLIQAQIGMSYAF